MRHIDPMSKCEVCPHLKIKASGIGGVMLTTCWYECELDKCDREEWMRDCKECENLRREIVDLKEQIVDVEQDLDIAQELAKNGEDHAVEAETELLDFREEIASIIGARLRQP